MYKEFQYVAIDGSDEIMLVDKNMDTGEYAEEFDTVIPERDVCFAVVPADEEMRASILRHGPRVNILRYIDESNRKIDAANSQASSFFTEYGLPDVGIRRLQFESARDNGWTLDEINRVLTTTNFIDTLIKEKNTITVTNENKEQE